MLSGHLGGDISEDLRLSPVAMRQMSELALSTLASLSFQSLSDCCLMYDSIILWIL